MTRRQRLARFIAWAALYTLALAILAYIAQAPCPARVDLGPCLERCESLWTTEDGCRPAGWGVVSVAPCRCGVVLP